MQIITQHGFGELEKKQEAGYTRVLLEKPFIGKKHLVLGEKESFRFSDWAVARVLNIGGAGWFSNLQFHRSKSDALEQIFVVPAPPDETLFLFDLDSGRVKISQTVGIPGEDYIWMKPWIDRWIREDTKCFERGSEATAAFKNERDSLGGTSGGIACNALFDVRKQELLWFYITVPPPLGVIFEKKLF